MGVVKCGFCTNGRNFADGSTCNVCLGKGEHYAMPGEAWVAIIGLGTVAAGIELLVDGTQQFLGQDHNIIWYLIVWAVVTTVTLLFTMLALRRRTKGVVVFGFVFSLPLTILAILGSNHLEARYEQSTAHVLSECSARIAGENIRISGIRKVGREMTVNVRESRSTKSSVVMQLHRQDEFAYAIQRDHFTNVRSRSDLRDNWVRVCTGSSSEGFKLGYVRGDVFDSIPHDFD